MQVSKSYYKKQGIHAITAIFTVERGVPKVLLIKRKNEPFMGEWCLTGGAIRNDEDLLDGAKREIFEKSGIKDIYIYEFKTFGKVDRSPVMRMIAIGYIGVIDCNRVNILKETTKTSNADWFRIDKIPSLAYDHEEILASAIDFLKQKITESNILSSLFPNNFTMPELQKVYEAILGKEFDRRNFRKKILSLNIVEDTNSTMKFECRKPAKLYKFKDNIENKSVF